MKFVKHLHLVLILAALFFISCDDQDDFVFTHPVMINDGIDFVSTNSDQQTIKLNINAQAEYQIISDAKWFTLSKTTIQRGFSTLAITFEKNKETPRHHEIKLRRKGEESSEQTLMIQQNAEKTTYEDVTHNIYMSVATMPGLYSALHILADETPSYFIHQKTNTFDLSQFPAHVTHLPVKNIGSELEINKVIREQIISINKSNPDAIFGLYIDDIRTKVSYNWFTGQGIDSSRVKVTQITDGSGSYNILYNQLGDAQEGETNWKTYEAEVNALDWNNHNIKHTKAEDTFASLNWPFYMSTLPNYRYILQDASLFETNSAFVQKKIDNEMNTYSINPKDLLHNLSPAKQEQFYKMVKFDQPTIQAMLDESPKENLIIISTSPSSSIMEYILETVELYKEDYDIFVSLHPGDTDGDLIREMEDVTAFPQGIPFEVLLWSFMDDIHAIGGSQSTVFISVPVEKVKFMYAKSAEEMVRPLNLKFKDATEINWMIK